jgi:hypothetical protein
MIMYEFDVDKEVKVCYREQGVPCTDGACGWCLHEEPEKNMTLGTLLKNIIRKEEDAAIEALRKEAAAKARRLEKVRAEREALMNAIEEEIVDKIIDGQKPMYKLYATDLRTWFNQCRFTPDRAVMPMDRDRYDVRVEWLKAEGLQLKVTEAHDGMGQRDWLEITVEPLPEMEVEAD